MMSKHRCGPRTHFMNLAPHLKVLDLIGQLISECLLDILNFPKTQQKIGHISALEYKHIGRNPRFDRVLHKGEIYVQATSINDVQF